MKRRNIKALNAQWRCVKRKCAFKLKQCLVSTVVSITRANHMAHQRMTSVSRSHLEKTELLATLWVVKHAVVASFLCQPLGQNLCVEKIDGQVNLCGNVSGFVVVALQEARDQLLLGNVQAFIQDKLNRADGTAFSHNKNAGGGDSFFSINTNEVNVD